MNKQLLLTIAAAIAVFPLVAQQIIPGKIECELYNRGGEGVAYHDTDSVNNGSGKLNPANGSFLNEFRMKEGVDISYTKEKGIDNSDFNKVKPDVEQLYVGWTAAGEWIKYDVIVNKNSEYTVDLMYTANGDGTVALEIDGNEMLRAKVPTTFDAADTIAWRQWHHWNKIESLGKMKLTKGPHVITLRTIDHGNMNFDFLEFKIASK
jgi:hypothetical protein